MQVLNIVQCNHSFSSADNDNIRSKLMFSDPKIAQGYSQGHTKANYMLQYGIVLYIKEELLKRIKDVLYCFKFDETTNSQIKKQYDGYITYYSQSKKCVVTSYCGSLFLGHCTAHDLLDHFYEFMSKLLNIGTDGPSVNKSVLKEGFARKTLYLFH